MNTVFFDDATIDGWIAEDAPFLDLTTHLLAIGSRRARISFVLRTPATAACTEEAARIVTRCGGQVESFVPSGTRVPANHPLLSAQGEAASLLRAWKVAQNLLEYACGIAGATTRMVDGVRAAAPGVGVLTTRKHPPGLRRIALKATLAGGALPHRLGVGESMLVFPQHRALLEGWPALADRIHIHGGGLAERKVVIEAASLDEALQAVQAGCDVVQFDKMPPEQLRVCCETLRKRQPSIWLIAAGGIHEGNAASYARAGVDALVTSSLHFAPPADIGVCVAPL